MSDDDFKGANNDGGVFTSEDSEILAIREEDTQPGPKLSEEERKRRLAERARRKKPPEPPAQPE